MRKHTIESLYRKLKRAGFNRKGILPIDQDQARGILEEMRCYYKNKNNMPRARVCALVRDGLLD